MWVVAQVNGKRVGRILEVCEDPHDAQVLMLAHSLHTIGPGESVVATEIRGQGTPTAKNVEFSLAELIEAGEMAFPIEIAQVVVEAVRRKRQFFEQLRL